MFSLIGTFLIMKGKIDTGVLGQKYDGKMPNNGEISWNRFTLSVLTHS
jgi:hypothetical protein